MLALYLSLCATEEDRHKITYIYENYYATMYSAVYSVVKNADIAPDLVHDTMIKLIKHSETVRLDDEFPLKTYIIAVAKNTARDYVRSKENQPTEDIDELYACLDTEEAAASALDLLIDQERYDELVQCIRSLPDTYKEACYLKYVCEMEDGAIATALNISYANAAMRIHRGRTLLQKRVAEIRKDQKYMMKP